MTLTLTVKDGDNATTTKIIPFNIKIGLGPAQLIISQYYEGDGSNRWVEITNVGSSDYDASATPHYLALLSNPFNASGGSYNSPAIQLIPNLAA